MARRDLYNQSGCLDLTAFYAIRNIQREEREAKYHKAQRKTSANTHNIRVARW